MHEGGEIDMRGIYCAVSVAKLTNIYSDELFQNSAEWIASSQTYEGGFSGCPDMEAHGGYAFCGLAALVLLNKEYLLNIQSFLVCEEFKKDKKHPEKSKYDRFLNCMLWFLNFHFLQTLQFHKSGIYSKIFNYFYRGGWLIDK